MLPNAWADGDCESGQPALKQVGAHGAVANWIDWLQR